MYYLWAIRERAAAPRGLSFVCLLTILLMVRSDWRLAGGALMVEKGEVERLAEEYSSRV